MKVYKSDSSNDMLCDICDNKVYKGSGSSDMICNIYGNKVYKGSSSSDMLCNIWDNKVYKGSSSSSSDMLFSATERFNTEQLAAILFVIGQIS